MRLQCSLCKHKQEGDHLAVACKGCGARGSMTFAPGAATLKPGEPICGPSKVPITRLPLSQMRGPDDEPLDVTRDRAAIKGQLMALGQNAIDATLEAERRVPVQCGRCGGEDPRCVVCSGVATAPTAALLERRAAAKPKRRARR